MPLTYKQIYDLDNSMVAAQQVLLGDIISYLSGCTVATGTFTPSTSACQVSTGLTSVGFATVTFAGATAGSAHTFSTVSGSSAGVILIKQWYLSGSVLTTGVAPFSSVTWRAYGT